MLMEGWLEASFEFSREVTVKERAMAAHTLCEREGSLFIVVA